jgi:putative membrane protein
MRILGLVFFIIVVLLGISFAVLNAEPVKLNYYFGSSSLPLSLVTVIAFAVGVILGILVSLFLILRLKSQNARLRKTIRNTEKEVNNLRNLPIKDSN